MRQPLSFLVLVLVCNALYADSPATVNNDDSCDVIVAPAATLLLPYFEVDLKGAGGETTLFTVTNVTQLPQIAHVTMWTDWSFPVLDFNIFLTGYDVQSIDLYDLLARGLLSGPDGTTSDWDVGDRSIENDENPLLNIRDCDILAVVIPPSYLQPIQAALTTGRYHSFWHGCPNEPVGGAHERAIGYLTIDVNRSCNISLPTDAEYFTSEILYDNVLTGDYQQVSPQKGVQGGPMVHIRAIPEGGMGPTNFTTTFYGSYQNGGTADRRQPLPATFAARWISAEDGLLKTTFKIWREGVTRGDPRCAVAPNSSLSIADIVRFDEDENPVAFSDCQTCGPSRSSLPVTSNRSSDDSVFPPNPDGAMAGWMYMNLDDRRMFPARSLEVASQNWVIVSMEAEGGYSVDFDAASLGNGCTPSVPPMESGKGDTVIAPAANTIKPAFASGSPATINNDDSCDIMVTPAATLLLPYFEVNPGDRTDRTTFFTITNVTPLPQIARVTLWTDWAFPVISFNLFLTGYDVVSIDLFDVIAHGRIAGGTSNRMPGRLSGDNDANPMLDTAECASALMDLIPPNILPDVRRALTEGRTAACGLTHRVGSMSPTGRASGYATIDVVADCGPTTPIDPGYFSKQVLYDNALIGDYQQLRARSGSAQGNPLVHIRAIPEGGRSGSAMTGLRRTFYSRLQNGGTADRRQPLPSTFAARWIAGSVGEFNTSVNIWREGATNATAGCVVASNAAMSRNDIVRFDEEENPTVFYYGCSATCPDPIWNVPVVRRLDIDNSGVNVPPNPDQALAGWMYFNLSRYLPDEIATQSWVVVSMASEDRFSVDFDAASLGNGCSPRTPYTDEDGGPRAIGPAPNINP